MGGYDLKDPRYDMTHIVGSIEAETVRLRDIACDLLCEKARRVELEEELGREQTLSISRHERNTNQNKTIGVMMLKIAELEAIVGDLSTPEWYFFEDDKCDPVQQNLIDDWKLYADPNELFTVFGYRIVQKNHYAFVYEQGKRRIRKNLIQIGPFESEEEAQAALDARVNEGGSV